MITRNRTKELEYFVRQYDEWKMELNHYNLAKETGEYADPTGNDAVRRKELEDKITLVDKCVADVVEEYLRPFFVLHVTRAVRYEYLRTKMGMNCGRRQFYEKRTQFFLYLSQKLRYLL